MDRWKLSKCGFCDCEMERDEHGDYVLIDDIKDIYCEVMRIMDELKQRLEVIKFSKAMDIELNENYYTGNKQVKLYFKK
ncbi:MAG: hypothetical protein PHY47_12725 [Lachnospiraceae bacterium]|nr:hypothetical protein [Lachnospiraceae bacterium]